MRSAALLLILAAACAPAASSPDGGPGRDASVPIDAGHVDAGTRDAGHVDAGQPDSGSPGGCTSDGECGANPCATATCGTCQLCDTSVHQCSTMQLNLCPYDGGTSDPNVTVFNASGGPHLQGQLIDVCCAFDGGTELATGFALTPDGTRALAAADNAQYTEELFLGPTGNPGTLTKATPASSWGIGFATFPAFSPDSKHLAGAFDTTADGAGNTYASLWLSNADGTDGTFVDQYIDAIYTGGSCLLYDSTEDGDTNQYGRSLHVETFTATGPGPNLEAYDEQPSPGFSPDGEHVAWLAQDGTFKALACSDLTTVHTLSTGASNWVGSPDGTKLLYVSLYTPDGGFYQGTVTLSGWDGSDAKTFGNVDQGDNLAWSADGSAFLYQTGSGAAHVLHVHELASGADWESPPAVEFDQPHFTADSAYVTYATGDPDTGQYAALYGVAVGASAGTAPVQYGTTAPLAWDATGAGGGWVAGLFADPNAGAAALEKSTLVVWPRGGGTSTTITTYAGPQVVGFSLDGQYLAFGSWSDDASLGYIQRAAVASRSGSAWNTAHLVAISPAFNFGDGFTAAWGQGDWLLAQSTTFGPAEALYVLKGDASDLGTLAELAAPEWYVAPGGAAAYYATSAGIWRVSF